jgi:type IV secretory pathway protease TraF
VIASSWSAGASGVNASSAEQTFEIGIGLFIVMERELPARHQNVIVRPPRGADREGATVVASNAKRGRTEGTMM